MDGYKERTVEDGNYVLRSNSQSDVNNKVAKVDLFKNATDTDFKNVTDLKHVLNFNTLNKNIYSNYNIVF